MFKHLQFGLLALVFSLSATATAHADVLVDHQPDLGQTVEGLDFQYDEALGRAWIEIEYYTGNVYDDQGNEKPWFVRAQVDGLSFDRKLSAVVYSKDGIAPTVCARLGHHWYGWALSNTHRCVITRTAITEQLDDDGYERHMVRYLDVYFGARAASDRQGD